MEIDKKITTNSLWYTDHKHGSQQRVRRSYLISASVPGRLGENKNRKGRKYTKYCHVLWTDYKRGMNWWMDLLTTYTHHSELHALTTLTLISTFYKSLAHAKSSQSSLDVSWQRIWTMKILQLLCSRRCPLANTPQLNSLLQTVLLTVLGTDHIENTVILLFRWCSLQRKRVYWAVAQKGVCNPVY
jgi:hypothetical protein